MGSDPVCIVDEQKFGNSVPAVGGPSMRITLVSACLECGGTERAVVSLAQGLMGRGSTITVITLSGEDKDFYSLPEGITRVALNIVPVVRAQNTLVRFRALVLRLRTLRRTISATQPDVIVSLLQHVNVLTLLALAGTSSPLVVSERNHPAMQSSGKQLNWLRRVTYGRAARLVSVSQDIDRCFTWLPRAKRAVIHNAVTPEFESVAETRSPRAGVPEKKLLVAMGRLTYLKGFDLLLNAFARVAGKHPDWDLIIVGEGELRSELEELREQLGLQDRVVLPGQLSNPFPLLRQAQLFVLPSRGEGFPNVLIEAMACGLPVIAADCPSGPNEIVRDGENGVLVPAQEVVALADAMNRLMSDEAERRRLANGGAEVKERFSLGKITDAWQELLHQVVKQGQG